MRKYEQLAKDIITNVGGKENINGLTHCVTRLRFQLKDESKANDEAIKGMEGVITLMKSAGQYQVVIGNHVPDVYAEVCQQAGIKADTANVEKKKMGVGATIIDFISGIMGPSMAVLMACGMIKGVVAVAEFAGWIDTAGGFYALLSGIGDSLFYFFPVVLGYNAAKKLAIDPWVGGMIGASLMYPTLQGVDLNILGLDINVSYTSTVLPVIFTTILASFVYKALMKVIPDVIKTFVVPMITMMVVIPIGFVAVGPVANFASNAIADFIVSAYNLSPILAGVLMGALWQVLVIFGIHMGLVAVALVQMMSGQPTAIFALSGFASFAQTAVVFAIWLKTKDKKLKNIALPAWISGVFGVTEPAIYGVTLPRMKFFVISCIGAALGGAYAGISGLLCYQMAGMGIFAIPGFFGGDMSIPTILMHFCIGLVISMGFSFIATFILYKDEATVTEVKKDRIENKEIIIAPIKGDILALSQATDAAFSSETLGKGVVINPSQGKVYAPFDGVVTMLYPTSHAIGITSDNGVELLIHLGIDTVQLDGEGFEPLVKQGDKVVKGQLLMNFDIEFITGKGLVMETPVIITNSNDMLDIVETSDKNVEVGSELLTVLF